MTNPIIAQAIARGEARAAATPRIDYAASNKAFRRQKAALTRAINSGNVDKLVETVQKHVREWAQPPFNGAWPDDWSRWQRALDDALPWNRHVDIRDLG